MSDPSNPVCENAGAPIMAAILVRAAVGVLKRSIFQHGMRSALDARFSRRLSPIDPSKPRGPHFLTALNLSVLDRLP